MSRIRDFFLGEIATRQNQAFGQNGVIFIKDTTEHTGPFVAITAITDAVVDVSECTTNIEDAADFTIPKGVTIYGKFTSIALDSGGILAYYE